MTEFSFFWVYCFFNISILADGVVVLSFKNLSTLPANLGAQTAQGSRTWTQPHLDSICCRLRWQRIARPTSTTQIKPTPTAGMDTHTNTHTSGQGCRVLYKHHIILQPGHHWSPCDLSPFCLFSPPCHWVKDIFSHFHTAVLCALCSICLSAVLGGFWRVHHGTHGRLTLTQSICHPQRGGGGCLCMLACLYVWVCVFYTHTQYMALEGAGMDVCIPSGNSTLCYLSHQKPAEYSCSIIPDCFCSFQAAVEGNWLLFPLHVTCTIF